MARDFTKNLSNYASLGLNAFGPLINGASAVSLAYWVQFDANSAGENNDQFTIRIGNLTGLSAQTSAGKILIGGRSQVGDSFRSLSSATTPATGTWYHVGAVINFATSNIIIYLDGVQNATGISGAFGSATYVHTSTTSVDSIGYLSNITSPASTTRQLDGQMAELGLWITALTAAEFASLAKGFTPDQIRPQSLVAYWPMREDGSNIIEVRNAKNATITGSIPRTDHPRVYT